MFVALRYCSRKRLLYWPGTGTVALFELAIRIDRRIAIWPGSKVSMSARYDAIVSSIIFLLD